MNVHPLAAAIGALSGAMKSAGAAADAILGREPLLAPDTQGNELVLRIDAERQKLQAQIGQQDQLFIRMLGEGSRPDLMVKYSEARMDLLALIKAQELGLIDRDDSAEALRHLRKKMREARIAAADAGGDVSEGNSVLQTSTFARLQQGGADLIGIGKGIVGSVTDQLMGVGQGMAGLMQNTPLGGGLFGLMMHGYREDDRMKAQLGEMVNLFVGAGESATDPMIKRMASFQEKAQRYYGISRHEVQSNIRNYIEAGVTMTQVFSVEDKQLGEAGSSAIHLGLALDRNFEWAAGTTSKMAVKAMRDYGSDLGEALSSMERMAFAAQKSGLGASDFIGWAFSATSNVRKLGITFEDAALVALEMQRGLMAKGVNSEVASGMARKGAEEMYAGLGRRSTGEQVYLAGVMGLGDDLQGRESLLEGIREPGRQLALVKAVYAQAQAAGGGNENSERYFLEQKGYGVEGARTVVYLGKTLNEKTKLEDLTATEKGQLRDSFATEASKVSDIEKSKRLMLEGMAESGRALMAILSNFAAIAIVGFVGLPVLIAGDPATRERTYNEIQSFYSAAGKNWDELMAGGAKSMQGVMQIMGPIIKPISRALAFNPRENDPQMERMRTVTEESSHGILDATLKQLTGQGMTAEAEALITGVTGMTKEQIEKMAGTKEGQDQLSAAIIAGRNRLAPTVNAVKAAGFKPGAAGRGAPAGGPLIPGLDPSGAMGLGSLAPGVQRDNPMDGYEAPGKPGPKPSKQGPTGALVPTTRWAVPAGYDGPLEVDVTVEVRHG